MAILVPRVRSINVRLSEAEYLELERLCVVAGARSMSDLVRSAMRSLVMGANQEGMLAMTINQHAAQVQDLKQKVESLAAELALLRTQVQPIEAGYTDNHTELREEQP